MDLKLEGKVALVTGSTAGIGFAIARSLVNEGAYVYVNGRSGERVEYAINEIRNHVPSARIEGIADGNDTFRKSWRGVAPKLRIISR